MGSIASCRCPWCTGGPGSLPSGSSVCPVHAGTQDSVPASAPQWGPGPFPWSFPWGLGPHVGCCLGKEAKGARATRFCEGACAAGGLRWGCRALFLGPPAPEAHGFPLVPSLLSLQGSQTESGTPVRHVWSFPHPLESQKLAGVLLSLSFAEAVAPDAQLTSVRVGAGEGGHEHRGLWLRPSLLVWVTLPCRQV